MNVTERQTALSEMTITQLRERYSELHGEPTRSGNRDYLVRRILWREQAQAEGGLEEQLARIRTKAKVLARDSDLRVKAPEPKRTREVAVPHDARLPLPGSWLTKQYRGRTIRVRVLRQGFEYAGERFKSLTAVAKAVTGSHWNGRLFFGLATQNRKEPANGKA